VPNHHALRQSLATVASATMLLEWDHSGPLRNLYVCRVPGKLDAHLTTMARSVVERASAFFEDEGATP